MYVRKLIETSPSAAQKAATLVRKAAGVKPAISVMSEAAAKQRRADKPTE